MKINKYILIISLLLAGCAQKSKLDWELKTLKQ